MALSPMTTTFTPQTNGGVFGINAYGPGYIEVNGQRYSISVRLHPDTGPLPLPDCSPATLAVRHIEDIARHTPELVLIGTGDRQMFPRAEILAPLIQRRIGVECMTLAAACRTFNLLASESRRVVALLLIDPVAN
jgi:uncharacterized protein